MVCPQGPPGCYVVVKYSIIERCLGLIERCFEHVTSETKTMFSLTVSVVDKPGRIIVYFKNWIWITLQCFERRTFRTSWLLQAFSTAAILTCHSRRNTGVTYNINLGSAVFKRPSETWQWASMHNSRTLKQRSLILWIRPCQMVVYSGSQWNLWNVTEW